MLDKGLRYYTPREVRVHSFEDDAFVSVNGLVLDLTPLIQHYQGTRFASLVQPLIRVAGTDISHWFDKETKDLKTCIDPETGFRTYAQPFGRFAHIPTLLPDSCIDLSYDVPWWQDEHYIVGRLTSKTRRIRIVNTLNGHEHTLEVCAEETLNEIVATRYLSINAHALSYTWRRHDPEGRDLDMTKTLDENGVVDESVEFESLGLNADHYIPAIHLYYDDDLTEA
ncbi:Cytochrome b5-like heme/steroid binding domain [Trypanosoma melophagium]|uniref:Cytochrome b5-like heme/steroid binding domain n=1 Tax=Trypanosoma melophagium TaxID=715481 RepID=UPI003519FB9B|nr:Cytochrome b5-like heme/steroid binding domain [Trypanosoma melophagium]